MRLAAAIAVLVLTACSNAGSTTATSHATPSPVPIKTPVPGSVIIGTGCGSTAIYEGGDLPDWATVNAPEIQYVVAAPAIAIGYLFSYPLKAGLDANTKILWYVGTPRGGYPLEALAIPSGLRLHQPHSARLRIHSQVRFIPPDRPSRCRGAGISRSHGRTARGRP